MFPPLVCVWARGSFTYSGHEPFVIFRPCWHFSWRVVFLFTRFGAAERTPLNFKRIVIVSASRCNLFFSPLY